MEPILTRCGYRCDLCLAYRPNAERDPANRQILSDGWHRYFGFRIPPEQICCDGCMAENATLIGVACAFKVQGSLAVCPYPAIHGTISPFRIARSM